MRHIQDGLLELLSSLSSGRYPSQIRTKCLEEEDVPEAYGSHCGSNYGSETSDRIDFGRESLRKLYIQD